MATTTARKTTAKKAPAKRTTRTKTTDSKTAISRARAAKTTATTAKKAATPKTTAKAAPTAAADRVERTRLAKAEHKKLAAWSAAGGKGARPATPNLDALETAAAQPRRTGKASTPRTVQTVRFFHDDKPMPDSQNKLSSVAWYYTKGCTSADSPRMTALELKTFLAGVGIDDPTTTEWSETLPNGIVLSTKRI